MQLTYILLHMRKNKWMHASVQKNTHATIDTIARVLARCYCEVRRGWCGHYYWIGHQRVSRVSCYHYKDHQRWQRWSLKLFLDHLICHTHQSILKISWDHPTNILRLWDIWEHYQGGRFGKLVHFLFQFDFSLQNKILGVMFGRRISPYVSVGFPEQGWGALEWWGI